MNNINIRFFFIILILQVSSLSFGQHVIDKDYERVIEKNIWTIKPQFDSAGHFVEDIALVKIKDKFGYINKQGSIIIKPQYDYARDFKNGFAVVGLKTDYRIVYGFINKLGNRISSMAYSEMKDFNEGLIAVKSIGTGKWGFMNDEGKTVISHNFINVSSFYNGLAFFDNGTIKGFINTVGKIVCSTEYNKIKYYSIDKSQYLLEGTNKIVDVYNYPVRLGNKWGYKRLMLEEYIFSNIDKWEMFLNSRLDKIEGYENYLRIHIEKDINEWQEKGEFEPTLKWKERVNEETRRKKIDELTVKYRKEYEEKLTNYKNKYAELVNEFEENYNKYRNEYYTLMSQYKVRGFKQTSFELMEYDADNQSFLIKSDKQGDILISVPLEEAPSFKQNWQTIKRTITPTFIPSGNDVVLTSVTIMNGDKKYVYDNHTQAKYAITDINYNFKPVEITIPNISDINYSFEPIEDIQLSVIQTSPHVKGIESNNLTIQKNLINAIKQSDIDVNIPLIEQKENNNTFIVIIANEDYLRVSDVPYANNDGEIFKTYCYNVLGVPKKNVKYVADASLNDLKYNLNWLKQLMEAYNGEASVIFYYAGHGIPDEVNKTAYLLPVDGYGSDVTTGYSLKSLYEELGSMPAKSVSVFLDACFSGTKREGDMLASARGVAIKVKETAPIGNMIVFSAAQGDETAYPYKEQRHGMFTYYLLKKLQETKGEATLGEICDYVTSEVRKQSIVINGKMQTPTLTPSVSVGNAWRNWKLK